MPLGGLDFERFVNGFMNLEHYFGLLETMYQQWCYIANSHYQLYGCTFNGFQH